MDFACTFPSSKTSISIGSYSYRLQHQRYCRNFLNDSRVFYRPALLSSKRKKKGMMLLVAGCAPLNGNLGNFLNFIDGDGCNFESLRSSLEGIVGSSYLVGPTSGLLCKKAKSRTVAGNFGNFLNPLRAFTRVRCQSNESLAYVNGSNGRNFEFTESPSEGTEDPPSMLEAGPALGEDTGAVEEVGPKDGDAPGLEDLRELLQKAVNELEVAQLNSTILEKKAHRISEYAIALKDEAAIASNHTAHMVSAFQEVIGSEVAVKEALQKNKRSLLMAEALLPLIIRSVDSEKELIVIAETPIQGDPNGEIASEPSYSLRDEEKLILAAQYEIQVRRMELADDEVLFKRLQFMIAELQKQVDRLSEMAEEAQMNSLKAEEDVANIKLLAEQAVAFELEATQRVNDAKIALQRAEKLVAVVDTPNASASVEVQSSQKQLSSDESGDEQEKVGDGVAADVNELVEDGSLDDGEILLDVRSLNFVEPGVEESKLSDELHHDQENRKSWESLKEVDVGAENTKLHAFQTKKQETQKDLTKDGSSLSAPQALLKKSSRFLSASFFSFDMDGTEFTPESVFHGLLATTKKQMPKLVLGALLLGAGAAFFSNTLQRSALLLQQSDVITTGIKEVTSTATPMVREIRRFPKRAKKLIEMLPHQEVQAIMSPQLSSLLIFVVGISVAFAPLLAVGGQLIASRFKQHEEIETYGLQDHIIICGFGRGGQIIAHLLSEQLITFVALDVRSDRVAVGHALDLPVYFGDAGSREVLHKVGSERACAAVITLDTPGSNYRTVWALSKYFPNVKIFVRAHDADHGLNLEKAGATAVVSETLESSLQLAAAVLAQMKWPTSEIAATINEFRNRHLSKLTELFEASGSSLGYGFSRVTTKPKPQASASDSDENQVVEGTLAI